MLHRFVADVNVLTRVRALRWLAVLPMLGVCLQATAQTLPAGPVRAFDGRVVVAGEVVATVGDTDDIAYFNYTDYRHNAFRMLRLGLSGLWQPARWIAFVGEARTENLGAVSASAAYIRIRPWPDRPLDIQAGRIPPSFGAFSRRTYSHDSPLIGYPLAYQYLTALRSDAVPASANDLLRMRGRGWRSSFPLGSTRPGPGVPLVSAFRWDTGVQVRWTHGPLEISGSVTSGSLSSPRVSDDNAGKQISGRLVVTPVAGLVVGTSAARGAWLSSNVPRPTPAPHLVQAAAGADVEYSRDHWLVRGETIWSRWTLPYPLAPSSNRSVSALAAWVEAQYRLTPRIVAASRLDRLGFSTIAGSAASVALPWDAPVNRVEASLGYYLQRNLVARLAVQANQRDSGRVRQRTYFAGQLAYWF